MTTGLLFNRKEVTECCSLFSGIWHRDFFTNGDVIDLLCALQQADINDSRKKLHSVITSKCPTSLNKYKLFARAQLVQSRAKPRYTSRRKRFSSSSMNTRTQIEGMVVVLNTIVLYYFDFDLCSPRHTLLLDDRSSSFLAKVFNIPKPKSRRAPLVSIGLNDSSGGMCKMRKKEIKRRPNKTVFSSQAQLRHNTTQKRPSSIFRDARKTPPKKKDQRDTPPRSVSVKSPLRKMAMAQVRGKKRSGPAKATRGAPSTPNMLLTLINALIPVHMATTTPSVTPPPPKACCNDLCMCILCLLVMLLRLMCILCL